MPKKPSRKKGPREINAIIESMEQLASDLCELDKECSRVLASTKRSVRGVADKKLKELGIDRKGGER